jgi:Rho guanine nucleotide exchange factor 4
MKKIAALINERKRKMESIEKLARWQLTVEDWQVNNTFFFPS